MYIFKGCTVVLAPRFRQRWFSSRYERCSRVRSFRMEDSAVLGASYQACGLCCLLL